MSWRFGECELDLGTRELTCEGHPVEIRPRARRLLELLLERHPAPTSRQEIRDALWPGAVVSESTLDSLIWELRTAIGDLPRGRFVRTVRGFGYAFSGEVARTGPAHPPAVGSAGPRLVWGERILSLKPGENLLGRGRTAAVRLDAPSVSRHHARIRVEGIRATLEDLGSRNGTRLNGERILGARELHEGDAIGIGAVRLTYRRRPVQGSTASE
jgi:DNA-binding winged helix-turn-helix (wHTH) protein